MPTAVLFDLDGTLLDTLLDMAEAMNRVLSRHGYPVHPAPAYRYFVGEGARRLVERAIPEEARSADEVALLLAAYLDDYGRNWNRLTRPYPGIPEMLACLEDAGVAMAVLSNKPHEITLACVRHFFPQQTFAQVLGQRAGVPRKPDPAAALEIAAQLKTPPVRIAYLGDTATDMETAHRAGMMPLGAGWGFRAVEELREAGAAHVLQHPSELPEILAAPGARAS